VVVRTGRGFTGATSVAFGGYLASAFIVNSDTQITALSPSQAAGTVDVLVTTAAGTSTPATADHFTYTAASAPAVTSISPTSGSTGGGTLVGSNGSGSTQARGRDFASETD